MPDKDFDKWISEAIDIEIGCSRQQKLAAWNRLAQTVSNQTVLAVSEEIPQPTDSFTNFVNAGRRFWNWFSSIVSEETCYDRARFNRNRMYHFTAIGDGSINIQILEPLSYRWMSPT
ncbi:MAG: hypothetical protein R3E39_04330 [Anaerolineae bacterium]